MANITVCCNGVPQPLEPCVPELAPGGINRIVFAACDVKFNDITDPAEWCYFVKKGKITMTGDVLGKKDKGTFTSKMVDSCSPQRPVGKTNTLTFTDFYLDVINFTDYTFYNRIRNEYKNYKFGYIKCDGSFTGFIDKFSIELDDVIEDSSTGSTFWDGTITWNGFDSIVPVIIPNLVNYLRAECQDVVNFNICNIYEELPTNVFASPPVSGFNANYRTDLNICENGLINITAPFVLGATYLYGNYDVDTDNFVLGLFDPIAVSTDNTLIQYQTSIFPAKGVYVAVYDPECTNPLNTNLGIFADPGFSTVPHINYLYLYDIMDTRPLFTATPVQTFFCTTNGYGETVAYIRANTITPATELEYQLQVNGVPGPWRDFTDTVTVGNSTYTGDEFINVPNGVHTVLIRSKLTGCVNQALVSVVC